MVFDDLFLLLEIAPIVDPLFESYLNRYFSLHFAFVLKPELLAILIKEILHHLFDNLYNY